MSLLNNLISFNRVGDHVTFVYILLLVLLKHFNAVTLCDHLEEGCASRTRKIEKRALLESYINLKSEFVFLEHDLYKEIYF